MFGDRFIGVLSVYHVDAAFYREDHRRLLDRVSEQAAAVVNNSMLFEQTQEDSLTDPLTSLPNTRYLFMHLTRELARAARLKGEVALLVMDVDNFKDINDTHGHHVGDRALCEIAGFLRTAIRPYDICVRYAGDEFIIVLSGCGVGEVEHKRQELQRGIEDIYFEGRPSKRVPLGMSIGAAVFPHDGEAYESLLSVADGRMYQDKAARKRQVAEFILDDTAARGGGYSVAALQPLTVCSIRRATPSSRIVRLSLDDSGFRFRAGQWARIGPEGSAELSPTRSRPLPKTPPGSAQSSFSSGSIRMDSGGGVRAAGPGAAARGPRTVRSVHFSRATG